MTARILITGLMAVVGLAGAEVFVRQLDRRRVPLPETGPLPLQPSPDPRLRFENRPGASQVLRYFDRRGEVVRTVVSAINEQGFRGPRVEPEKPTGTYRIVVIGDSQSFGTGVAADESWPAVLQGSLASIVRDVRIEVMNCSVSGYDAEQTLAGLETHWLSYRPDLVLLGYFVNDPTLPGILPERHSGLWHRLMPIVVPGRRGFVGWLRARSACVDFVMDGLYRRARVHEWARGGAALHRDDFGGWIRTRAALARERELCEFQGVRFGVVLVPFLVRWDGGLLSTTPYRAVAGFCQSAGIPCVDLEPCFAGMDLQNILVNDHDPHSGPQAHRIEGESVARWILDQRLLPEPDSPREAGR